MQPLWNTPTSSCGTLVLAHGAGAPMDSDFMADMAARLCEHGLNVLRFEFPYMDRRRQTGKKAPPDRAPVLLDSFREQLARFEDAERVFVGGKSLGGRMASMLATEVDVEGVVCLGYPFHPPGRPERTRLAHLPDLRAPLLICQGERDPFGHRAEVANYGLPGGVELHWLPDGDHDLRPRKRSGYRHEDNLAQAARMIAQWCGC